MTREVKHNIEFYIKMAGVLTTLGLCFYKAGKMENKLDNVATSVSDLTKKVDAITTKPEFRTAQN